jgi:hypothetical protein
MLCLRAHGLDLKKDIGDKNSYKVNDEQEHGRKDHRRIGRFPHSHRAFITVIALVATHQTNGKAKEKGFDGGRYYVSVGQGVKGLIKVQEKGNVSL